MGYDEHLEISTSEKLPDTNAILTDNSQNEAATHRDASDEVVTYFNDQLICRRVNSNLCVRRAELPEGMTLIQAHLFEKYPIETVSIPKSVEEIQFRAFYCCSALREAVFASGSELRMIGEESFRRSGIQCMTMPCNARTICSGAFSGCKQLRRVVLNKGL